MKLVTTLALLLVALTLAPAAHAAGAKPEKSGGSDRYKRAEHGPGTDAGRKGASWQKHTEPRPGRETTKNRQQKGWQDRSGKRK